MSKATEICSRNRWDRLCTDLGLKADDRIYDTLIAAHAERHRAYHTLDHIAAMLRHLDAVPHLTERPAEIEMSIWFHDAIYKPFSATNEEDSAAWAAKWLRAVGAKENTINRIFEFIIATKSHDAPPSNAGQIMLGIDLSILAAPAEIYDTYELDIRREYKRVPGFIFRKKRKALLAGFLERPKIYAHSHFHEKWDSQARLNLRRAIAAL